MKTTLYSLAFALIASSAVIAQDSTTVRTTASTGTLTDYVPGTTLILKEESAPVTYRYGKEVVYVTKSGKSSPRTC